MVRRHSGPIAAVAVMLLFGGVAAPAAQAQDRPKLYYDECPAFQQEMTFDCYHTYAEVARFLHDVAERYPDRARVESIGESWEGRDLWLITITDFGDGDPDEKPGIWVDGGIDADEVVAIEAALGVVHRLVTSDEPEIAELRRTRTFYIAPAVIPDISDLHHTTPLRPRDTTSRPWDDDGDGELDEDGPNDLDGDGQALRMRVEDPDGRYVKDERDPRVLRRRRPADTGPFYTTYTEALDEDGDGRYGEDPIGGIDPNRNYPGNWSAGQGGSGPFPGSELELRAMLDFILERPNIAASQHFHSSGGVILRPPSVPELDLPSSDYELYMDIAHEGMRVTGYPLATSVYDWNWPRGSRNRRSGQIWRSPDGGLRGWNEDLVAYGAADAGLSGRLAEVLTAPSRTAPPPVAGSAELDGRLADSNAGAGGRPDADSPGRGLAESAYPAYGGSIDGMYLLFGALSFANEIYTMGRDYDEDGEIDEFEQLRYNDEEMDGAAFQDWTPFEHPELGPVEIGGWRKFGHNNPLPGDLPEEVRRNVEFVLLQANRTPLLAMAGTEVEDLGGGIYRVRATVRNTGAQPTELAIRRQRGTAVPVRATIDAQAGIEILTPDERIDLGTIDGHSSAEAEWLVRAPNGGSVTVTVRHPKSGIATTVVELVDGTAS